MRTTFVPPLTAETARELQQRKTVPPASTEPGFKLTRTDTLLVGFDFGTNTCCLKAAHVGSSDLVVNEMVPTVVGYATEGIVENLLPNNARVLYGHTALKNRLYLRLVFPMQDGVIADLPAARDYARHLRQVINPQAGTELRAVIGIPANADRTARESMYQTVAGLFDRVMLVPEPFLAALGYRDESRLADPAYLDPVRNSLIIDIGAGTTNVCLVQGYYPTTEDQMSIPFAGDKVDGLLAEEVAKAYPDANLSLLKVREIKEQYSYVGKPENQIVVSLVIGGKLRKLDIGEAVGLCCEQLLQRVFDSVKSMIAQASTDSVAELMQNLILTGGGSRIQHIDSELQRLLAEEGYEKPRVQTVGSEFKQYVAKGALLAARQARENQWQRLG